MDNTIKAVVIISNLGDIFALHGYTYKENGKQVKVDVNISYTNKGYQSKESMEENESLVYVEPVTFFNHLEVRTKESLARAMKNVKDALKEVLIDHYYITLEETDKFIFEKSDFYKETFFEDSGNILEVVDDFTALTLNQEVINTFLYLDTLIKYETEQNKDYFIFNEMVVRNLWKYKLKRPDLLLHAKLVISKDPQVFYQTNIKDISKIGTKSNEAPYAVAFLNENVPILESLRKVMDFNYTNVVHLPLIFKSFPAFILSSFGDKGVSFIYRMRDRNKIKDKRIKLKKVGNIKDLPKDRSKLVYRIEEIDIAENVYPVNLTYRSREIFTYLHGLLSKYVKGELSLPIRDITDLIYNEKGLIPEITTKTLSINVKVTEGKKTKNVKLLLGSSMPSRNVLKRLEKKSPKVELIVDVNNEYRYFTVTTCKDGSIIMTEYYCDVMLGF